MRRNIRVSRLLRRDFAASARRGRVVPGCGCCQAIALRLSHYHNRNVPGCPAGEKAGIVQLRLLSICMLLLGVIPSAAVFQAEGSGVSLRSDDKQLASLTRILGRLAQAMREGQSVCERL